MSARFGVALDAMVFRVILLRRSRSHLHRFLGGATAEIAGRQSNGTWLWVADQPNVTG